MLQLEEVGVKLRDVLVVACRGSGFGVSALGFGIGRMPALLGSEKDTPLPLMIWFMALRPIWYQTR